MAQAIIIFVWPIIISYCVYKSILAVAWPPRFSPIVSGLGGSLTLLGKAFYVLGKTQPEFAAWWLATYSVGIALLFLPKIWMMVQRSATNPRLPPHMFDEKK